MKKVFILHILPLELYPPVMNLLNVLSKDTSLKTAVFSTFNHLGKPDFKLDNISIQRTVYPANTSNIISKIWSFFTSIFVPLLQMKVFKPDILMYFEPHSAFPAYIYKKFFNRKVRIFIHYHEYYTIVEFKAPAMASVNFYHQLEVDFLYKKSEWISQTNIDRLNFFSKDYSFIAKEKFHVLANYPPTSWYSDQRVALKPGILKMFYIGAISFESTYIKELVEFVSLRPNKMLLDIYSYNIHSDAKLFLKSLKAPNINFFDNGIPYDEIPEIALKYQLGLVLYKPHNTNYTYNAPNKLFEYLACGLDVLVPEPMLGCKPYLNSETKPNVLSVDFENMTEDVFESFLPTMQLRREVLFNCDTELKPLIRAFKS